VNIFGGFDDVVWKSETETLRIIPSDGLHPVRPTAEKARIPKPGPQVLYARLVLRREDRDSKFELEWPAQHIVVIPFRQASVDVHCLQTIAGDDFEVHSVTAGVNVETA